MFRFEKHGTACTMSRTILKRAWLEKLRIFVLANIIEMLTSIHPPPRANPGAWKIHNRKSGLLLLDLNLLLFFFAFVIGRTGACTACHASRVYR